jgi:hypothetical protein
LGQVELPPHPRVVPPERPVTPGFFARRSGCRSVRTSESRDADGWLVTYLVFCVIRTHVRRWRNDRRRRTYRPHRGHRRTGGGSETEAARATELILDPSASGRIGSTCIQTDRAGYARTAFARRGVMHGRRSGPSSSSCGVRCPPDEVSGVPTAGGDGAVIGAAAARDRRRACHGSSECGRTPGGEGEARRRVGREGARREGVGREG